MAVPRLAQRWYSPPLTGCRPQPLRCWEYMSANGLVREECQQCVVYRVRASWCFDVLGVGAGSEHGRQFCQSQASCQECAYYQRVFSLPAKVLVISSDEDMCLRLESEDDQRISLLFAINSYEASKLVGQFRPNFVVVEEDGATGLDRGLVNSLVRETRAPGMKLILAVSNASHDFSAVGAGTLAGIINKPLSRIAISAIIAEVPVEHKETTAGCPKSF